MHRSTLHGFGIGFKTAHFSALLDDSTPLDFIEIHAENFMGEGGLPHAQLRALREKYQLSLHGVALSIGGESPLDLEHLQRLKKLITLYQPESFSEHLAWSSHQEYFYNDLLPLAYTQKALNTVCAHISQAQDYLNTQLLLENPSTYLEITLHEYSESAFIKEITHRTGCGLLLDLNNVYISATNHGLNPHDYLKDFPLAAVREIHLAGFTPTQDEEGHPLLIDAHATPIDAAVWSLYQDIRPLLPQAATLIEWDNDVPTYEILKAEADQARAITAHALMETQLCP